MQDLRFRAGWQSESGLAHNGTALLPLKTMPQLPLQKKIHISACESKPISKTSHQEIAGRYPPKLPGLQCCTNVKRHKRWTPRGSFSRQKNIKADIPFWAIIPEKKTWQAHVSTFLVEHLAQLQFDDLPEFTTRRNWEPISRKRDLWSYLVFLLT